MLVVKAAIRDHDGTVYSVDPPGRHHHIIQLMVARGCPTPISGEQGFLLSDETFVGRELAQQIAIQQGQVLDMNKLRGDILFSEDLW